MRSHPGMEDVAALVLIPSVAMPFNTRHFCRGGMPTPGGFLAALALERKAWSWERGSFLQHECPAHPRIKDWFVKRKRTTP